MKTAAATAHLAEDRHHSPPAPEIARNWNCEMSAMLGLSSDQEFLAAAVGFAASITQARAGFLFGASPSGAGQVQCLFSRMRGRIHPFQLNAPEVQAAIRQALESGAQVRSELPEAGDGSVLLALPVADLAGKGRWALSVWLGPERLADAEDCAALLQVPSLLLDQRRRAGRLDRLQTGFNQATLFLELLSRSGAAEDFEHAMAALSQELREFVDCHQVAVGLGTRQRCPVAALSGAGKFDASSQPAVLLRALMEESIGVDAAVGWPPSRDLPDNLMVSGNHDALLEALDVQFAAAIPLKTEDGETIGAWACLFRQNGTQAARRWELIESMSPHVAAVTRLIAQGKPRGKLARWRRILRKQSKARLGIFATVAALAGGALFIPVPYPIAADCRLEPVVTRQVAAPFDGILAKPAVKPGTIVKEGQLLATLDGKEIGWRLAEAVSKRDAALKKRAQGIAGEDVAATQLADLEVKARDLEVKLLTYQQQNLEIHAPMDGLILRGDLEQSEGVPVSKGQQLFELARIDQLRVEIAVPDSEISRVRAGLKAGLRLESQVHFQREAEIEKVAPASVTKDNRNVFLCHATVTNESGDLRPGMEGKARVISEPKPLGWILFHGPWDYLRLHLWY